MMYVSCHDKDNSEVSRARTPTPSPLGAIAIPKSIPSLQPGSKRIVRIVRKGETRQKKRRAEVVQKGVGDSYKWSKLDLLVK